MNEKKNQRIIHFNRKDIEPLLAHAKACAEHDPTLGQQFDPALRRDGKELPKGTMPGDDDVDPRKVP